jgi:subtilisin family serine protease
LATHPVQRKTAGAICSEKSNKNNQKCFSAAVGSPAPASVWPSAIPELLRRYNLSLGQPVLSSYATDPLCQAVEQAWNAGIVVVVAAGNEGRNNSAGTNGYGTITSPGNDPLAITVGAMNTLGTPARSDDKIASYSSKGPSQIDHVIKPDLVAPGNRIISDTAGNSSYLSQTYRQNEVPKYIYAGNGNGKGDYFQLSGTSMAAPMVSGSAAVLLQKNPMLTPDQVKAILMKTASKFPQTTSVATVRSGNRAPLAFECSAPVAAGFSGRRADRRASVPSSAAMLGGCTRGHIPVGALSLRAARQCS